MNDHQSDLLVQWWCDNCGGEGDIFISLEKSDDPALVICSHCSFPSAYVWCEECGMGGQIANTDFRKRPTHWNCKACHSEYSLPDNFYETPINFVPVAFADIEETKRIEAERKYFREYQHVNPAFLQKILLLWSKHRIRTYIWSHLILFGIIILLSVLQIDSNSVELSQLMAVCFLGLLGIYFVDLLTSIVSGFYRLIYKLRKSQEI